MTVLIQQKYRLLKMTSPNGRNRPPLHSKRFQERIAEMGKFDASLQ